MVKILICEDIESSARRLVEEAEKDDYETFVLAKDLDSAYVLSNLEDTIKSQHPQYMIIDGLNGKCFEAIDLALKTDPKLVAILYSASREYVERARQMGIQAFHKKSSQELDNMFWYIVECEKEKR